MKNQNIKPSIWQLLLIWSNIGLQSFGGGSSTILLIQRTFIEKYQWLTMEEYLHFWNLCLLTPGINILAMTILIGRKLGGMKGIIVSVMGILLPSALVTCFLTVVFTQVEHNTAVQAVLRGVIPATGGITALVGLNNLITLMRKGSKEGRIYTVASCLLILACAIAIIYFKLQVAIVVLGAIMIGALFLAPRSQPLAPELNDEEAGGQQ